MFCSNISLYEAQGPISFCGHILYMLPVGGGSGGVVTPYIMVYADVLQVWVMFSHLLAFIRVINSRF